MLIGNYAVLNKTPGRWLSGGSSAGTNQAQARGNWGNTGPARGIHYQDGGTAAAKTWGVFQGGYDQYAPMMPYTQQEMTSRYEGDFALSASGSGVLGMPGEGSASFSITVADADGQLISSGEGSASFSISTNAPLLTASIGGTGSATFSITTNTPILGAEASLTASAALAFSGSLTPYAIGIMEGTTEVASSVPTADQNASAVWSKLLSNSQTAENTLLSAGSAGDPWIADLDSYGSGTAGKVMALMSKILRNKSVTNPNTGQMTVYDDDGVTPLLVANLYEDSAGATPYRGKGAERRERLE